MCVLLSVHLCNYFKVKLQYPDRQHCRQGADSKLQSVCVIDECCQGACSITGSILHVRVEPKIFRCNGVYRLIYY
eukprot:jgi/Chrzof1/10812/Cz05g13030.t1